MEYPLDITYFSSDVKNQCVTFEIRMEVVGAGWKNPIPVNRPLKMIHNIANEPNMDRFGSLQYQIRSRKGNSVSSWSDPLRICDNEKPITMPFSELYNEISSDEEFNFGMTMSRAQEGSYYLFEYYKES